MKRKIMAWLLAKLRKPRVLPDAKFAFHVEEYDPNNNSVLVRVSVPEEFDAWVGTHVNNRGHIDWVPVGGAMTWTLPGGHDER